MISWKDWQKKVVESWIKWQNMSPYLVFRLMGFERREAARVPKCWDHCRCCRCIHYSNVERIVLPKMYNFFLPVYRKNSCRTVWILYKDSVHRVRCSLVTTMFSSEFKFRKILTDLAYTPRSTQQGGSIGDFAVLINGIVTTRGSARLI